MQEGISDLWQHLCLPLISYPGHLVMVQTLTYTHHVRRGRP